MTNSRPDSFRGYFGSTTISAISTSTTVFITARFLLYLTDYSGLDTVWAALFGSTVLVAIRVLSAFLCPFLGQMMDINRYLGRISYKAFLAISAILQTIGYAFVFYIPSGIRSSTWLSGLWLGFFYLMIEIGIGLDSSSILRQEMTLDVGVRSKQTMYLKVFAVLIGIGLSFSMKIYNLILSGFAHGNIQLAHFVMSLLLIIPSLILFVAGYRVIPEQYRVNSALKGRVRLGSIFTVLKKNKALRVHLVATLCEGFVNTLIFGATGYYLKWGYCSDSSGILNNELYGNYSMLMSISVLLPMFISAILSTKIVKKINSVRTMQLACSMIAVFGLVFFILQITGIMKMSIWLFMGIYLILQFVYGLFTVPQTIIRLECIDYNEFLTGNANGGLILAFCKLIDKLQAALSSALIAIMLIISRYSVNELGNLVVHQEADKNRMLTMFAVSIGFLPAILCIGAVLIYKLYPINDKKRTEVTNYLRDKRNEEYGTHANN